MIQADRIGKSYGGPDDAIVILDQLSLHIDEGRSVAIMGPSGSGKSTLLHILGALEPPSSGTILIAGADPYTLPTAQLASFRNRTIGFIFQDHHLLPQCTSLENVLLPTLAGGPRHAQRIEEARDLLKRVGLTERTDHLPAALSGGERQRTAIARALIQKPKVVLADEPTGNLDAATSDRVMDLLLTLHADSQRVLIAVTHSERVARRFDQRFRLDGGRLREM